MSVFYVKTAKSRWRLEATRCGSPFAESWVETVFDNFFYDSICCRLILVRLLFRFSREYNFLFANSLHFIAHIMIAVLAALGIEFYLNLPCGTVGSKLEHTFLSFVLKLSPPPRINFLATPLLRNI